MGDATANGDATEARWEVANGDATEARWEVAEVARTAAAVL
jgi:hypothetical protein